MISRKCYRVADLENDEPRRQVTHELGSINAAEDITFQFKVIKIDGCADEYDNVLHETVQIET